MKLPRYLASLLLVVTAVPLLGASAPTTQVASPVELAPSRSTVDDRATRGAERTPVVPLETTTTTAAPTTTTTEAPTTTTTAAPTTTTTTAAPQAPASSSVNAQAAEVARAQVGKSYVLGAVGPNSFDCSGLIIYAYRQAGVEMPRITTEGFDKYTSISKSELQPGDVIYKPGHVGIYVGNGKMVHASTPRGGVKLAAIDAPGTPTAYYRI